jgi:hypothetical protein
MRVVFWPVLALVLAIAVSAEIRVQADPPAKGQNAPADEGTDADALFPLVKRNGIEMRIVEKSASADKNIVRRDIVPSFIGGQEVLNTIVAHPENATAIQLAAAADVTYRAGDLPEAAFLFYAARLRVYQDLEKYPPNESQAAGTNWLLGVLLDGVKIDLIRGLYLQPKVLADVVKRLESFELKEPASYDPGWDYTRHDVPADLFAKNKATMLAAIKPTSQLLLLPEYFAAFREYRDCDLLLTSDPIKGGRGLAEVEKRRKNAADTMRRIENEMKLQGPMYQVDQAPPVD